MSNTNNQSATTVDEIADGIYRLSTPIMIPGTSGFSFNQYLIADEQPLLFHTGPRALFTQVSQAVASVMPLDKLCYMAFSHMEADECGSLNSWLAAAEGASPLCGKVGAMVSIGDFADRPPVALDDGQLLSLGRHSVRWYDTPHLPHAWDCGFLMEEHTSTLLCGDLFTQEGANLAPITESDILAPSEAFRKKMDYFSHTTNAGAMLETLAGTDPITLACMHGSAWRGNGRELLLALSDALAT